MTNQTNSIDAEIVQPSALEAIQRAEVDMQITTAKRYPRQLVAVKQSMLSFATLDQETAESCFYSLPRGGKNIQGPSVRLAEIAVSCYGNLRAGARILSTVTSGDSPHVVIQAVAHDLEKNVAVTIEKRRRITKKKNKPTIDEDDINLAANAGSAVAFRDAVFKVVPLALIKPVYEQAKRVAIGDAKTLGDRRTKAVEAFSKMGVSKDRVLQRIGKKAVEEIMLEDLEVLIGLHTAIKDGELSIDEAFDKPVTPSEPSFDKPESKQKTVTPPPEPTTAPADPEPTLTEPKAPAESTLQADLKGFLTDAGVDFDDFADWLLGSGRITKTGRQMLESWDDVPDEICEALKNDPKALTKCVTIYGGKK